MTEPVARAVAGAVAAVVVAALARMAGSRLPTHENFRGTRVALVGAVVPLGVLAAFVATPTRLALAGVCAAAVAATVGAFDDHRGDAATRGLRGHVAAVRAGRLTTGLLKIPGLLVAGALAAVLLGHDGARLVGDAVLVTASANLVNLFDLRPGRALKVVALAALPLAAPRTGASAAAVAGCAVALLPGDLAERRMLGDTGANAIGAALGAAIAATVSDRWLLSVLAGVVLSTLVSEVVSFSRVIDAVPPLRWVDRLGRRA